MYTFFLCYNQFVTWYTWMVVVSYYLQVEGSHKDYIMIWAGKELVNILVTNSTS